MIFSAINCYYPSFSKALSLLNKWHLVLDEVLSKTSIPLYWLYNNKEISCLLFFRHTLLLKSELWQQCNIAAFLYTQKYF